MKSMDFFAMLGAGPQQYFMYCKGLQQRRVKKDATSCQPFSETEYVGPVS